VVPELVGSESVLADILSGDLQRFELAWINREDPDGQISYLRIVELPNCDEKGQIAGLLHLTQDTTEAGLLQQQLGQQRNELRLTQDQLARQNLDLAAANAELRRLEEIKSTFVAVAAHELRTPLSVIQGYVEMLADEEVGPLSEGQRNYLGIIEDRAKRLMEIIGRMLDVTRIEAGRVELVLQPTDLPTLVQKTAADLENQIAARRQHLALHYVPELPPALCDPMRAAQIVSNLMSNAIKYTPEQGHIRVAVDPAAEAGFLQVSVADDGVGIAPEDHDKLFLRFFRTASAVQTGASGAGLGLYITHALVQLHGGRIWLSSELGRGTIFYVTLPIAG
jgi:signal transduction histidine kinase